MSFPEGWDGTSLKEHVETAQNTADNSYYRAQTVCDELETLKVEVDEKASKSDLEEGLEAIQEVRNDLNILKTELNSIAALGAPITIGLAERMAIDDLAGQIEPLGKMLSSLCSQFAEDAFVRHTKIDGISLGEQAFCNSLAAQIRDFCNQNLESGDE